MKGIPQGDQQQINSLRYLYNQYIDEIFSKQNRLEEIQKQMQIDNFKFAVVLEREILIGSIKRLQIEAKELDGKINILAGIEIKN